MRGNAVLADAASSRSTPLKRTHKREVRLYCPAHHSRTYSLIETPVPDLRKRRVWGENVWPDLDSIEFNTTEQSPTGYLQEEFGTSHTRDRGPQLLNRVPDGSTGSHHQSRTPSCRSY